VLKTAEAAAKLPLILSACVLRESELRGGGLDFRLTWRGRESLRRMKTSCELHCVLDEDMLDAGKLGTFAQSTDSARWVSTCSSSCRDRYRVRQLRCGVYMHPTRASDEMPRKPAPHGCRASETRRHLVLGVPPVITGELSRGTCVLRTALHLLLIRRRATVATSQAPSER
jgi:hypothetical protein